MTTLAKDKVILKSLTSLAVKDATKGIVEAVFATFNVKDHDDDYTLPGAFENGAAVAISSYGHRVWMGGKPIGRGTIRVEKDRAVLEGQFFMDTIDGADTFNVVKNMGELQEWSYGFHILKTGELTEPLRQAGVRRVLEKLEVFEVSPVLLGAGVDTGTLAVKSRATLPNPEPSPTDPMIATPEQLSAYRKEFEKFIKSGARLGV